MNFMTYWATKGDWYRANHKQGIGYYERVKAVNPWMISLVVAALIFSTM